MTTHWDTSQVDHLTVDLSEAPRRLQHAAPKTMKKSALRIKERMKKDFSGHRHARQVPFSLEFVQLDRLGLSFEIGELDSAGRQWGLAAILAYGTSNNTPVVDHRASLREETPIMLNFLGADAANAVLGGDRVTSLTFDLDPADVAVLALLDLENLPVHVGTVPDSDGNAKIVTASLPYVLYGSTLGFSTSPRLGGSRDRTMTFTTTATSDHFHGAKAVALAVRSYLSGASVTIDGRPRRICLDSPDRDVYVDKDETWTRPGGLPLFFTVDRWYVQAS